MKNRTLIETPQFKLSLEYRWPAAAIGFYGGGKSRVPRTFVILFAPVVIQIGRRSYGE